MLLQDKIYNNFFNQISFNTPRLDHYMFKVNQDKVEPIIFLPRRAHDVRPESHEPLGDTAKNEETPKELPKQGFM